MNGDLLRGFLLTVFGFVSGSVMFSRIIPLAILKKDVCRNSKDGNPGAANVFKNCGIAVGMLCLLLDMAKGFFPVFLAEKMIDTDSIIFSIIMTAPVMGHAIAPFNRFRGGKCIATSFGVLVALAVKDAMGLILLAVIYILFSTVVKISPNRRRSIVAFAIFAVCSAVLYVYKKKYSFAFGCLAISLTAIERHITDRSEAGEGQNRTADQPLKNDI